MSKKIYCHAQFKPKPGKEKELFEVLKALEPNTLREDGCISYIVTRHIESSFAAGESYPIVFTEIWESNEVFEAHCQRKEIASFFETHCVNPDGLAQAHNICVYTDEPEDYDKPVL
jgi:quinol monooxygenase YgiN